MSQQRRIDVGLYELAIAQRNAAWHEVEHQKARVETLLAAIRFVVDDNDWRTWLPMAHVGGEWSRLSVEMVMTEIEKALR